MPFDVKATTGVVTGRVAPGAYMDAAQVGSTAGLEVALEQVHAFDAARSERHAPLVLSLDFAPETGRALAVTLALKLGLPAFNEREWRVIALALDAAGEHGMATQIHAAYGWQKDEVYG